MKRFILIGLIGLITSCSNANRPDSGGFYSYVDAQGNLITLPRQPAAAEPAPAAVPAPSADTSRPAAEELDTDALAQQDEYQTDEEVQALLEKRERDRFISYTDASGYRVTEPVDVRSAREAKASAPPAYESLQGSSAGFIERVEGVPELCCIAPLKQAQVLKTGLETLVSFDPPWDWVSMPTRHPAVAIRLEPGTAALRFQSFLGPRGYLHPQAVFMNEQGIPLLLVDNLFSKRYPETWHRLGYLEGEVPVEAGVVWLVLYLGYAGESSRGRPEVLPGEYYWAEPSRPLALQGELVVRALRQVSAP
jgi:hypothetical protein